MATPNRAGKRDTGTREKLLDACAEIMLDEGYAAATSRRVAEKVGVQRAVVYYYFPTMDDLYLAVLKRGTQTSLDVQRRALTTERPLHALWDMTVDPRGVQLIMEFMALGNHRKEIRAELAAGAQAFREAQVAALTYILRDHQADQPLPAEVISVLIAAIGRLLVIETGLGITTGHQQTIDLVHQYLGRLETPLR
ncbi:MULTISPECIES: TetR/AcrR family transcriptional regulator [Mycobacteriaceae]|uniref:TetR family transcriptional regulator n=3 Tax=Mycobacteriaceae TaxID=1762 RepID=A0A378U9Y5_MYCFO|nr:MULTISPECIES: TetR/AcrR family transcriptional regulator [Mycobacteriaceae]AIY46713.1 Transcriptional regulator, TetR family [Mycobacterium sp. VKM Ac-1817D]CRL79536.1 TetR family transcriptional regulator [Mycolicibacter nonchromogenicus]EJZ09788.1 TetR family transcriptional regulator [Mycolicibacterium fortuitum subsp. fortuitum DSM 46621 = ATCC 6841 = JCM 6387]MCG7609016.1 TetR/AcrR family transcriptional regulator [Mycobacterium sp. CnD-18-1]OHT96393.1 TetR family transcriptional regul